MILPTLRQLQFLAALGDSSSFSRAAKICNVTQPTLSAAIKELEDLLGVQLVERQLRGARLTAAGESAVRRARPILEQTKELVSVVSRAAGLFEGPFQLGAVPTVGPFVLAQTLAALRTEYPKAQLILSEEKTDRLIDDLRHHRLDVAIIALPWQTSGITALSVFDDEFLVAVPEQHPLGRKAQLAPTDLAEEALLLLEDGHCLRDHALSLCGQGDRTSGDAGPGAKLAATSLATLVTMVAAGLGVSLLPRLAIENGLHIDPSIKLRPFTEPLMGRSVGVAWRTGAAQEAEARVIAGLLKRSFAS